jgi:hypothetical protein
VAFVSELFDQLRDILDDTGDTQVSFATKKLYLNRGIARLWPAVWRLAVTTVAFLEAEIVDSPLTISDGRVVMVEYSYDSDADNYVLTDGYDIRPGDEDYEQYFYPTFVPAEGSQFRITYAAPIPMISAASYAAAGSETWTGPDRAIGLPVLYAAGMIALRRVDNRQDHTRYSTTQAINGVTDADIMESGRMWLGQFELELDRIERPLPIARD